MPSVIYKQVKAILSNLEKNKKAQGIIFIAVAIILTRQEPALQSSISARFCLGFCNDALVGTTVSLPGPLPESLLICAPFSSCDDGSDGNGILRISTVLLLLSRPRVMKILTSSNVALTSLSLRIKICGALGLHLQNLEIQDIQGIGPTTAKKLKEAGIVSVMDLAVTSADELAVDINASKESAAAFIMAAQKLLRDSRIIEKEFLTADLALEKRKSMLRCSTGSKALDELLLGGIETQTVTEFYGEFGSGKSQICHTLCATARQPIESGGMDSGVIYIDTEGTFRPERLEQIARARGLDHRDVLRSVAVCKIYNSSHLELIISVNMSMILKQSW